MRQTLFSSRTYLCAFASVCAFLLCGQLSFQDENFGLDPVPCKKGEQLATAFLPLQLVCLNASQPRAATRRANFNFRLRSKKQLTPRLPQLVAALQSDFRCPADGADFESKAVGFDFKKICEVSKGNFTRAF